MFVVKLKLHDESKHKAPFDIFISTARKLLSLEVLVFMGTIDSSLPSVCANIKGTVCCVVYFRVRKV
jgi:hypothetical protein